MRPGEKQALAAAFFVMLSLAIAFGIGWWATLPPLPATTGDERFAPQAKGLPLFENERAVDGSSGSSDLATHAVESAATQEAKGAFTAALPTINEIRRQQPTSPEENLSTAADAPALRDKSEPSPSQPVPDIRSEEVNRLKTEAYSETRKDKLGGAAPAKSKPKETSVKQQPASLPKSAAKSKSADLRRALAKCDEEYGLFFRERCKWRLCNGQWGKNGCPSYSREKQDSYSFG